MTYRIAVVGATGVVGREMLSILAERAFPVREVIALASPESVHRELSFGENITLKVEALPDHDFLNIDIALLSAGADISAQFAPKIAEKGAVVIDNSSHFRMQPDIPLVVPEVNPDALPFHAGHSIIANPNCSTIQLVTALAPLHRHTPIRRVVVASYQSASGSGRKGMDELFNQTRGIYMNVPPRAQHFPKRIAFNVIPCIDRFLDSGATREEWKMMVETGKILDPDIKVIATCVRVPVFVGHALAATIEFAEDLDEDEAREILAEAPGVIISDRHDEQASITPVECVGEDAVYVSRIRRDPTVDYGLCLWIVADNLRKGAALNAVQIAEVVIKNWKH